MRSMSHIRSRRHINSISIHASATRSLPWALSLLLAVGPMVPSALGTQHQRKGNTRGQLTEDRRIAHVLNRLTFGAGPGDLERVREMGVDAFIAQQLDPDSIGDGALALRLRKLPTLGMATPVLIEQYTPPKPVASPSPKPVETPKPQAAVVSPAIAEAKSEMRKPDGPTATPNAAPNAESTKPADEASKAQAEMAKKDDNSQKPAAQSAATPAPKPTPPPKNPQMVVGELQRAAMLRAVYSERQLNEMMVDFWENHFSVFANKDADRFLLTGFDRDTVRPFALGRFRDLLGATAHSPAMLYYLDNWRSSVPRPYPATKNKPAGIDGGINENYARELMELHTLGVDGGYTQKDVEEVARCFTGWTIEKPDQEGLFLYRPGLHDNGEKMVLGHRIAAGGGIADGERVLDILATHPSTAQFIARKLARRFIGDDPPRSVVDRAAAVFLKTDGSIRETLRAIVTSPEFFAAPAYRAKLRTPFEYVAAALRAVNAETDADPALVGWTARMGQPIFGRLTPDGFPDRADQWLAPGSVLERLNFAVALASNKIKGTHIDHAALLGGSDRTGPQAVVDHLAAALLAGDAGQPTREAAAKMAQDESTKSATMAPPNISATTPNINNAGYQGEPSKSAPPAPPPPYSQLIAILLGSPEFQRR